MKECLNPGCYKPVDPEINPLWCPECNARRMDWISRQLDRMSEELRTTYADDSETHVDRKVTED